MRTSLSAGGPLWDRHSRVANGRGDGCSGPRRRASPARLIPRDTPGAVSRETVEIVRRAIAAFQAGDIERILALTHPDFEGTVAPQLSAEPDTYRGKEGIERYFASFREAFDQISFEPEGFSDAGDSVVVALRMTAVGKQTKIPVEQRNAGVWTLHEGRIARIDTYSSMSDALKALGLS
jgi:ketosteroid isomerase-like protein